MQKKLLFAGTSVSNVSIFCFKSLWTEYFWIWNVGWTKKTFKDVWRLIDNENKGYFQSQFGWYFLSAFTKRTDRPEFCIPLKSFFSFSLLLMLVVVLPEECGLLKRPVSRDSTSFFLTEMYNSAAALDSCRTAVALILQRVIFSALFQHC